MELNDTRSKIIKPIIICLLILCVVLSYLIFIKYHNFKTFSYNGNDYSVTDEITDKNIIASIKNNYLNTNKKDNGYKIYIEKNNEASDEICVESHTGRFYNTSPKNSQ